MYDHNIPVIMPGLVLLLPIVYTASYASWRITVVTGCFGMVYLVRHNYLNRGEYVSHAASISSDDVSRMLVFAVAVFGLAAIAHFRDRQSLVQAALQSAFQAASEANRAKSEFLAVLSHELRTPLTTIIQYTDLLNAGIGGRLEPEQREMVRRIENGALHLRGIIQQLLDYAQLEAGKVTPRPEPVDLAQLARTTAAMLESTADARGLALRIEVAEQPVFVETDAGKVRQILLNLLDNALKFTDAGAITVRLEAETDGASLTVTDSGIGMVDAELQQIFQPFWQSEDALTRTRGGLGLGLAITRQLAAALGARLTVSSAPARGTTFQLHLPATLEPPAADSAPDGPAGAESRG